MDYQKQAEDFLTATNTTFSITFLGFLPAPWDKQSSKRAAYFVRFERPGKRPLLIPTFYDSLYKTAALHAKQNHLAPPPLGHYRKGSYPFIHKGITFHSFKELQKAVQPPDAYDVLACITKYPPGSFSEWCAEFGESEDSRKAHDTWTAVWEEWSNVSQFFTAAELEQLQEIN
jgi:hypothetical protein